MAMGSALGYRLARLLSASGCVQRSAVYCQKIEGARGESHFVGATLLLTIVLALIFDQRVGTGGHWATAATPTPSPNVETGAPVPEFLSYAAGWNLIGLPQEGVAVPVRGSLYTLAPGGAAYQTIAPAESQAGVGYWAFFLAAVRFPVVPRSTCDRLIPDPANPALVRCAPGFPPIPLPVGQWVMVSNPYSTPIAVQGADVVEGYDPGSGAYQPLARLEVGQGAFAYSAGGGLLEFVLASP